MKTNGSKAKGKHETEDGGTHAVVRGLERLESQAGLAISMARDAKARLDERVRRHPYGMLAAALGVGYVLGGGLSSPLTSRAIRFGLRLGWRVALIPMLETELLGIAAEA
ncbi:hypothetical protein HY251_00845, partial [bacterium]|nr:hypothetical protein [bacterium]